MAQEVQQEEECLSPSSRRTRRAPSTSISLSFWLLLVLADVLMLATSNFVFSFSAFKLDLKARFSWDEPTVSMVWSAANAGMNFVVHIGRLYDRCGGKATAILAGCLKLIGLVGMACIATYGIDAPLLLGLFFFCDAQGTAAAITIGQSEALRFTDPARSGSIMSVVKSAFGMGPILWTHAYRGFFAPRVEWALLTAGLLGSALLITFGLLLPSSSPFGFKGKIKFEKKSLLQTVRTLDFFVISGTVSVVTWGSSLVWLSNISSFVVAAGYERHSSMMSSILFFANLGARLLIGPLMDLLRFPKEIWVFIASSMMVLSSAIMLFSGGALLPLAAFLSGAGFGADASLCPVMCKRISSEHMATIYSIAKIGGLIVSTAWIYIGSLEAQRKAAGSANCVGEACYQSLWLAMLAVTVPALSVTGLWAVTSARHQKTE